MASIFKDGSVRFKHNGDIIEYSAATEKLVVNGKPDNPKYKPCFAPNGDDTEDADFIGVYEVSTNKFISISGRELNVVESENDIL